jgi:hypothetical protein
VDSTPDAALAQEQVLAAALRRAEALAAGDEAALRLLMHPSLQWTTLRGDVLGYEDYIIGNTRGSLRWRAQRLADIRVTVAGDTAVLTAAVTDEVSREGNDRILRLRLTQAWIRTLEGWRCLAGHASLPVLLPGPTRSRGTVSTGTAATRARPCPRTEERWSEATERRGRRQGLKAPEGRASGASAGNTAAGQVARRRCRLGGILGAFTAPVHNSCCYPGQLACFLAVIRFKSDTE